MSVLFLLAVSAVVVKERDWLLLWPEKGELFLWAGPWGLLMPWQLLPPRSYSGLADVQTDSHLSAFLCPSDRMAAVVRALCCSFQKDRDIKIIWKAQREMGKRARKLPTWLFSLTWLRGHLLHGVWCLSIICKQCLIMLLVSAPLFTQTRIRCSRLPQMRRCLLGEQWRWPAGLLRMTTLLCSGPTRPSRPSTLERSEVRWSTQMNEEGALQES